jgi:hypothetical protein
VGLQVKVRQALLGMRRLDHQNQQQQSSSSVSVISVEDAELHATCVVGALHCKPNSSLATLTFFVFSNIFFQHVAD